MTYETSRKEMGRKPLTILEIDVAVCSLTYGIAPCTAAIGTTGADKCYNCVSSCQDVTNYTPEEKTFRFVDQMITDPELAPSYKQLRTVSAVPTQIDPGKGLGIRASVSMTLQDEADGDVGFDPYVRERAYDPKTQGTFWGKWKARFPFYPGSTVRHLTGYLTAAGLYDPTNFITRLYVLEKLDGPDNSGAVKLTGKDILKLADDDRAQCPAPSNGFLTSDISAVETSILLSPTGIGDLEYAASGMARIGDEIVAFTRSGDVLTITRAQDNTEAAPGNAADVVQQCRVWTNATVQSVLYDLLTEFGNIDPSFIDLAQWDAEADVWLSGYTISATIASPTGVTKLVNELCESGAFYCWWDELAQTIPFKVIRPDAYGESVALNETYHLVSGSVNQRTNPDDRLTQVWIFYGLKSPTADKELVTNYNNRYCLSNSDAESLTLGFGDVRIRKVFSRWIPTDSDSMAKVAAFRILNQFLDVPEEISFEVDAKDGDLWTGDTATLVSRMLQDFTGASSAVKVQVTQATERITGTKFSYVAMRSQFNGRYFYIAPNDAPDYEDATAEQRLRYGYICQNDGKMSDGSPGYQII